MSKIFGREGTIKQMAVTLKEESILLNAERRIGKTTVLKQFQNIYKDEYLIVFSDLEKVSSPIEFVNDILTMVEPFISGKDKTKGWFYKLTLSLQAVEIAGVLKIPKQESLNWKSLLLLTIKAICDNNNKIVVFLWDEVPYMLQKINEYEKEKEGGVNSSLEIMDALRSLRQEHKNLRMVLTGSIGFHHVLKGINQDRFAAESINDMYKISLEAIQHEAAVQMVASMLGDSLTDNEEADKLTSHIAKHCDNVPFYIERLIKQLKANGQIINCAKIDEEISDILSNSLDVWELEHFRSRLEIYFDGAVIDTQDKQIKRYKIAKTIISHCAIEHSSQSVDDCFNAVKAQHSIDDRDLIVAILNNLIKDHYLRRDSEGFYHFNFSLVRRWWILAEGLNSAQGKYDA